MNRFVQIAATLAILAGLIWLTLPAFGDYSPRSSVAAAIMYSGNVKSALESACIEGAFDSKRTLADVGMSSSDPKAYVLRADLSRPTRSAARFKATLTAIYGHPFFGLFPWKVIPEGRSLNFEFTCTADRQFSSRFTGSDLEHKYLPASFRAP